MLSEKIHHWSLQQNHTIRSIFSVSILSHCLHITALINERWGRLLSVATELPDPLQPWQNIKHPINACMTSYPSGGTRAAELLMFGTSSFPRPIRHADWTFLQVYSLLFLCLSPSFNTFVLLSLLLFLSPPSDPSLPLLISLLLHFSPPSYWAWGQQRSSALSSVSLLNIIKDPSLQ